MAYNVFKRPMFKRGGTPAKGTGIMSHVEPRVKAANGFPNLGITQAPINPQTGMTAYEEMLAARQGPTFAPARSIPNIPGAGFGFLSPSNMTPAQQQMNIKVPTSQADVQGFSEDQFITGLDEYGPTVDYEQIPKEQMSKFRQNLPEFMQQRPKDTTSQKGIVTLPVYDETETEGGAVDVASLIKKEPPPTKKGKPGKKLDTAETARAEVEKEAKIIRDLLKDEQYSKGELALLVAESLRTPGGINKKLDTARKLGGEIAKERRKEDKAITLEAYKRFKEKEKEQIKAGKLGDTAQFIEERIKLGLKNAKKTISPTGETLYDGLTENQFREDVMSKRLGEDKYSESLAKVRLGQDSIRIGKAIDKINELQSKQKTGTLTKDETTELAKKTSFVKGYSKLPGFKDVFGASLDDPNYIGGFASGGRVNFVEGGMTEDDSVNEIVTSEVASNNNETPVKTVQKLSYAELRARLPKEITDDVVTLLANSEQALQDFAYLQTQQDVGNFNVKYGVNLVLPPQA